MELTFNNGRASTVTVVVPTTVVAHPARLPLTVYVVVDAGFTVREDPPAPVFQVYVLTPDAVSVADVPAHTVAAFTVMTGAVPTVTLAVAVLTQPAEDVPVTV